MYLVVKKKCGVPPKNTPEKLLQIRKSTSRVNFHVSIILRTTNLERYNCVLHMAQVEGFWGPPTGHPNWYVCPHWCSPPAMIDPLRTRVPTPTLAPCCTMVMVYINNRVNR